MKNKGFVLMETIVVIVVISVALITIFSSYNKILSKVKSENKYDTSEYVYMTEYVKKYLKDESCGTIEADDIFPSFGSVSLTEHYLANTCDISTNNEDGSPVMKKFPIKKIYILTNLNNFNKEVNGVNNSEYFDACMIDYIRQLDVSDKDELLIVEYERPAVDRNFKQKEMDTNITSILDKEKKLYETYIASLEW